MDEADLRELLAVFLLDAPGRLERIGRHLAERDDAGRRAAAHEAHSLCGAAATVQLDDLALEAALLEQDLRAGGSRLGRAGGRLDSMVALLAELDVEAEPAAAPRAAGATQRMVLHVEDNPVNVKLIERALARRPEVKLVTATRAETGIRIARAARPDLILLDLNLPDASGHDFLSRLRTDPATCDVPVVIVTADASARSGESLRGLGIREYLTKPIDIGRLLELVDEHAPTASCRGNGRR